MRDAGLVPNFSRTYWWIILSFDFMLSFERCSDSAWTARIASATCSVTDLCPRKAGVHRPSASPASPCSS